MLNDLYCREEHQYLNGPVRARPGERQRFEWGELVVQALPRAPLSALQRDDTTCCAGCHYAIDNVLATARCERCHRLYHADVSGPDGADEPSSCFGTDLPDASNTRFCIECLPPKFPLSPQMRLQQREVVSIMYDFERWGFTVVKIEHIFNERLTSVNQQARAAMVARKAANDDGGLLKWPNEQRLYHLSSAGWGHVCETGLDVARASEGLFGRALYFSPDPKKCDDYWRRATKEGNDAGAVSVASTGKDPLTTRVMFACKVLLGKTREFGPQQHDRTLRAPPDGYDSVEGIINGQRELAVYANEQTLLDYVVTYELPRERAIRQARDYDTAQHQSQAHKIKRQRMASQRQILDREFVMQLDKDQSLAKEEERLHIDLQRVADITEWELLTTESDGVDALDGSMCTICLDPLFGVQVPPPADGWPLTDETPVRLGRCHWHGFHAGCLLPCFKPCPPMRVRTTPQSIRTAWPDDPLRHNFVQAADLRETILGHVACPLCQEVYGVRTGDAPPGYAKLDYSEQPLPGMPPTSTLPGDGEPVPCGHFIFDVYIPGYAAHCT